MAPFTQIAYIPRQKGFFLSGDEDSAYQSTVVDFMKNSTQNIGLVIPLPTNATRLIRDYKISELEILFRESDGVAVKVLESLTTSQITAASGTNNFFTYDYQSRKPLKTLPEAQTIRVYDKVPVRALSQESSGNRIIYGNYIDQQTPPANINYNCRISFKNDTGKYNNWIEYPNHSVKRNRNYQIGFVLADKFGRQSSVILSSVDGGANSDGFFYFGSTIYSAYDINDADTNVLNWFGDAIMVLVNSEISSLKNSATGTPGLYAIKQNANNASADGYAVKITGNVIVDNTTYTFRLADGLTEFPNNTNIPRVNDSMRGAHEDFVVVTAVTGPTGAQGQYTVTTTGRVNDVYLRAEDLALGSPDLKFAYTINDLGWYSYKIVVKQTEQEYYNVYLPGILNGYPGQSGVLPDFSVDPEILEVPGGVVNGLFPTGELNKTAFIALFNDNINKIPRDLAEVGPDQRQYRSSIELYGRVTNIMTVGTELEPSIPYNTQYHARLDYAGRTAVAHMSTAIATAKESNMSFADLTGPHPPNGNTNALNGRSSFYQLETNPLIARISTTEKSIGATSLEFFGPPEGLGNLNVPTGADSMLPYLAIYETQAFESLLDLYWETTSEGLIVDLNADVLSNSGGATSFINVTWDFTETTLPFTDLTAVFTPVNSEGVVYSVPTTATLFSQKNGNGDTVELFKLISFDAGSLAGSYKIQFIGNADEQPLTFTESSRITDVYSFVIEVTTYEGGSPSFITQIPLVGQVGGFGALENKYPSLDLIEAQTWTNTTQILLPAAAVHGAVNGTGSTTPGDDQLNLSYSMEGIEGELNPIDLYGWDIDPDNGQITQSLDGTLAPNGIWQVRVILQDAFDEENPTGPYSWLSVYQDVTITLGYPSVNPGALGMCVIDTFEGAQGPYSEADTLLSQAITTPPVALAPLPSISPFVTGCWYLGDSLIGVEGGSDGVTLPTSFTDVENLTYPDAANPSFNRHYNRKYKIGGAEGTAHQTGTVMFTINILCNQSTTPPFDFLSLYIDKIEIWYRRKDEVGDLTDWQLTEWNNEYNQLTNPPIENGEWPIAPMQSNVNGSTDVPYYYKIENDTLRVQYIRSFQKEDFDTGALTSDIEYAIIIKDIARSGLGNGDDPIAWVTADDVHYPTCVNWQGINAATTSSNDRAGSALGSFKYEASSGSDNSVEVDTDLSVTLWADTPCGDYVNNFYTDANLINIWIPADDSVKFINFRLDTTNFSTSLPLWYVNGLPYRMQWIAEFDPNGGGKGSGEQFSRARASLIGKYENILGDDFPGFYDGYLEQMYKGATRLYQNL